MKSSRLFVALTLVAMVASAQGPAPGELPLDTGVTGSTPWWPPDARRLLHPLVTGSIGLLSAVTPGYTGATFRSSPRQGA